MTAAGHGIGNRSEYEPADPAVTVRGHDDDRAR
jgi:hypothetical protein